MIYKKQQFDLQIKNKMVINNFVYLNKEYYKWFDKTVPITDAKIKKAIKKKEPVIMRILEFDFAELFSSLLSSDESRHKRKMLNVIFDKAEILFDAQTKLRNIK